jgi:uncharacterized damage-inducible protein DinB
MLPPWTKSGSRRFSFSFKTAKSTILIIAKQNIHFLVQGQELLVTLAAERYAAPGPHGQASAGAHLRHVIDCYRCFLAGYPKGTIDYDARERDRRIETDRDVAFATIAEIIDRLQQLPEDGLALPVKIQVDTVAWDQGKNMWTDSTIARELQFLLSHTVHHYALIALILRCHGFDPGPEFGVAPSTLEYRKSLAPAVEAAEKAPAVVSAPCAR